MKTTQGNFIHIKYRAVAVLALLLTSLAAHAAGQTWTGGSVANGAWSTGSNWGGGAAPGSTVVTTSPDVAIFNTPIANTWGNTAVNPVVIDSVSQNIAGINFTGNAGNYFIGSTGSNSLLLTNGGTIQIQASLTATNATETINAPLVIEGANGTYTLQNNSANGVGAGAGSLNTGGAISGGAVGNTVLNLAGANTNGNLIRGAISNGAATTLAVTKSGAGSWALLGNNTYTGATSIQNGILYITSVSAGATPQSLGAGTTVNLGVAATSSGWLAYQAPAGTLDKTINVLGNGNDIVQNIGTGLLTLSGPINNNGTNLSLSGGANGINVTGVIGGALPGSQLVIIGGTTTISTAAAYNGQTLVSNGGTLTLGVNNAIPSSSALTLGNGVNPGKLNMGTHTNTIGSLSFGGGAGGGTVAMAANQTASPQLSSAGAVALGTTNTLDLTGMLTSAGLYRLVGGSSLTGTFGTVTGLNSNYSLVYGTVNANELDAQHKATAALALGGNAAIVRVGAQTVNLFIGNTAPTGSAGLSYTLGGVAGSGTRTAGDAGAVNGITGSYTAVAGVNSFNITATDPNATNSPQSVAFSQTAYRLAGTNSITTPVNLGNVHVGDTFATSALSIQNTAANDGFSEKLDALFVGTTGLANTNGGSISLLAPQSTDNSSMVVRMGGNTATAGAKSGTVTVDLVSNGAGTSGLGTTDLGTQIITVTGTVFRLASVNSITTPVALGNVHLGGTFGTSALSIQNTAANDGFSEKLDTSFGPNGGVASNNGGSINLLAPQSTNNSSMVMGLGGNTYTGTVGVKTGTVTVNLVSDGAGTSGLGTTTLVPQTQVVTVTGTVFRLASASSPITTLATVPDNGGNNVIASGGNGVNFGTVHVGGSFGTSALTITNLVTNDGFSEKLDASFGANTGVASNNGGSINLLAAQSNDNSSMVVGLGGNANTGTAGPKSGTVTVNFVSDGAGTSGLANTTLASQTVNVAGYVYSGQSTWTGPSGGSWGVLPDVPGNNFGANWGINQGSPGLDPGFAGVDTATFGNAGGNVTVNLNGASPNLNAITFNSTGSYTIAQGTGATGLTLAGANPTITAAGTHTISAPVTFATGVTVGVTAVGDSLTVSGAIGQTGGAQILTKTGAGALTLSGNNTYSGGTILNGGQLNINSATAIGTGGLTISAGTTIDNTSGGAITLSNNNTQTWNGNFTFAGTNNLNMGTGAVTMSGNTQVTVNASTLTEGGVIGGAAGLMKLGNGKLILAANNSYLGATNVNGGTLQVNTNGALGTTAVATTVASGATLLLNNVNYAAMEGLTLNGAGVGGLGALTNIGTSTFAGAINLGSSSTISAGGAGQQLTLTGGINKNGVTLTIGGGGTVIVSNNGITGAAAGSDLVVDNSTLVLNTTNSYNGPTTIQNFGILKLGANNVLPTAPRTDLTINTNGQFNMASYNDSVASLTGDSTAIVRNSMIGTTSTFTIIGTGTTTFAGSIQGTLGNTQGNINLVKDGTGSLTLSGDNTYGNTYLYNGVLSGNLGLGTLYYFGGTYNGTAPNIFNTGANLNVSLTPGVPTTMSVSNTYRQGPFSALTVQVGGTADGMHDLLAVGNMVYLNGTLIIKQLDTTGTNPFRFQVGQRVNLITAGNVVSTGSVSGSFLLPNIQPINYGGFNTGTITDARIMYYAKSVVLATVYNSYTGTLTDPNYGTPLSLTENQKSVGSNLDLLKRNDPLLVNTINNILIGNLPYAYDLIAPEELSALYEINFAAANVQQGNLEDRMQNIRNGSTGFSSSLSVSGEQGGTVSPDGKTIVDKASSLNTELGNRWGVFLSGNGDYLTVRSDANATGYNFTTAGVTLGVDYRANENFAIGLAADYAHTCTNLVNDGKIDVDSGRGGIYATYFSGSFYVNGFAGGGVNSYSIKRSSLLGVNGQGNPLLGTASGNTDGQELDLFLSGGYDFHRGPWTNGPIASVQYSDVFLNGYTETGSLTPLNIVAQSQYSLATNLGWRLSYTGMAGKVLVTPQAKVSWQHQYGNVALPIDAQFANNTGGVFETRGPSLGRDNVLVSLGVTVQFSPTIETFLSFDGQFGAAIQSESVTGGFKISF